MKKIAAMASCVLFSGSVFAFGENDCINNALSNVMNTGFGASGATSGTSCAHVSALTTTQWTDWGDNQGWAGDDLTNFVSDLSNPGIEYICANGIGGSGFGDAAGNSTVSALQTCANNGVGVNEIGLEGIDDFSESFGEASGFNYCVNRSAATVVNLGNASSGYAEDVNCYQRSELNNEEWMNVFENSYDAGDTVDASYLNLTSPSIRFICMNGNGGAGFGSGSGNTSVTSLQACDNNGIGSL